MHLGMINDIRQEFNQVYEDLIRHNAENDDIGFEEFRYRMRIIENSKRTMNEELDFLLMMLLRRDMESGEEV